MLGHSVFLLMLLFIAGGILGACLAAILMAGMQLRRRGQ
jgi:hypothetical protein